MDKKEVFRQILIELMNEGLLNEFISIVFNYNLNENDFIYAQYKIVNNNIILNIFDNNVKNRFNAYIFNEDSQRAFIEIDKDNNTSMVNLYLDNCYNKYKQNNNTSNLIKLAASFRAKDIKELKEIINNMFPIEIENIIYKEIKKASL